MSIAARIGCLLLMFGASIAHATDGATIDEAIAAGRTRLGALVEDQNVPAVQVAVWMNGEIVWSEAFGEANVETRTPATTTTRFRIASISKALTGALLAKIAAEGRIDLDRPIGELIEDYPAPGAGVTARQLASHTAGVRHYRGEEINSTQTYPTLRSALAIFAADDLLFEPGERYSYTTYGFTALGAVMEEATETEFFELMRTELLEPLGMTHTVEDERTPIIPDRATSYELLRDGVVVNARPTDHSYKVPGGGILSTAEDLVTLGTALIEPGFFDSRAMELLTTPTRLNDGRATGYSLGWNVRATDDGATRLSHTGSQPGSTCALVVRPDQRIAVAILTNTRGAPGIGRETNELADLFATVEGTPARP